MKCQSTTRTGRECPYTAAYIISIKMLGYVDDLPVCTRHRRAWLDNYRFVGEVAIGLLDSVDKIVSSC